MTQHDNILIVPTKPVELIGGLKQYSDGWHLELFKGAYIRLVKLPPGSWRIVGRALELTEEQWRGILPSLTATENLFEDYVQSDLRGFTAVAGSATESAMSLMRAKGLDLETNPLILKRDEV